jgi:hypothetical protein
MKKSLPSYVAAFLPFCCNNIMIRIVSLFSFKIIRVKCVNLYSVVKCIYFATFHVIFNSSTWNTHAHTSLIQIFIYSSTVRITQKHTTCTINTEGLLFVYEYNIRIVYITYTIHEHLSYVYCTFYHAWPTANGCCLCDFINLWLDITILSMLFSKYDII